MACAAHVSVSKSTRRGFFLLWLTVAILVLALVGGGEDDFAARAAILEQASANAVVVEATAVRQVEISVVRLTRKGPRQQPLTYTEFSYTLDGRKVLSNAQGSWEAGTRLQVHLDKNEPSTIYTTAPAAVLHELKLNHYGTMLTNKVFVLSMFSFFLGFIYKVKSEPDNEAAPPKEGTAV